MMLYAIYVTCSVLRIGMGFYCAHKMTETNPLWVRLIVLSPSLTALFTVPDLVDGARIVTAASVGRAISIVLVYALITSMFTSRPWLDLGVKK